MYRENIISTLLTEIVVIFKNLNMATYIYKLDELICGYLRTHRNQLDLWMDIPLEIGQIVHLLFPRARYKFGAFKEDQFEVSDDGDTIEGTGDCGGYLIFADLGEFNDTGISKGVHSWSLQSTISGGSNCYASVGVLCEKTDFLINQWSSEFNWVHGSDHDHHEDWPTHITSSFIDLTDKWLLNDIITIQLDCTNWTVTYFKGSDEIEKHEISEGAYYFATNRCSSSAYTMLKVVDSPLMTQST